MGRSNLQKEKSVVREPDHTETTLGSQKRIYDPALTSLFKNSLGPVKPYGKSWAHPKSSFLPTALSGSSNEAESIGHDALLETSIEHVDRDLRQVRHSGAQTYITLEGKLSSRNRKRKRKDAEDNLEGRYMNELARQEIKEDERHAKNLGNKRRKHEHSNMLHGESGSQDAGDESKSESVEPATGDEGYSSTGELPQHESVVKSKQDLDLEKSSRTVFLANVSTMAIKSKAAKKILLDHLTSFTAALPKQETKHGIESFRFRSTAFASNAIPRKAAYAKKELMDTTTKSTNAYAVYTTQLAAREAAKRLNGTVVLDRHLRLDSVAHPAKIDHRRCIFVGNLGFVNDTSNMDAVESEESNKRPRKPKEPADIEEGLWRHFGKAGIVESVRVVRDKTTRVGKGFAYVQFENANAVEAALLYNEKKFPPMLPRILRVTRAKNIQKASAHKATAGAYNKEDAAAATYKPRIPSKVQSLTGRSGKLLGRAGAAQLRAAGEKRATMTIAKNPESIVFEGYRASSQQGKGVLKSRKAGKKTGKPSVRSRKFKAQGKKKAES